jgi:DNA-directed RNA polymerase subunit RPC12/RpoP
MGKGSMMRILKAILAWFGFYRSTATIYLCPECNTKRPMVKWVQELTQHSERDGVRMFKPGRAWLTLKCGHRLWMKAKE